MPSNSVQTLQLAHHSVRRFTRRPLDPGQLEQLVRCGQAAPSSSFIQAYSLVRVSDADVRARIAEAAGGQRWVVEAAEFLVFCADLKRVDQACQARDMGELEGYAEHSLAAVVDVTLMAQNMLLAAQSQGLGGVFIGGIRNDPQLVVDLLHLPHLVMPVFGLCLGWPDESNEVKPRMPTSMILHQDTYRVAAEDELADYDRTMAAYYARRASNARLSDWRATTAQAVQGKQRRHMRDFLAAQAFFRK